jgi:hypothetical protein
VIFVVTILVTLTVLVAAFLLSPGLTDGQVVYDNVPDRPVAFGYRMAWLALKTRDTAAVVEALRLVDPSVANWDSGIGTVYDDRLGQSHVFVTPAVSGWTFVVGLPLPHPVGRAFVDKCTPLLVDLGGRFPDVQYFFTYPLIDFFAWARVTDGRLVRAFAMSDEGIVWNKGRTTKEERSLGLRLFELRGVRGRRGDAGGEIILHPTEDHVMRLANKWSLDPTRLGAASGDTGLGLVARVPSSWQMERLRKTA